MTSEKKQEFTLRITNANKSEMIVILCDMFIAYCNDALSSFDRDDFSAFHSDLSKSRNVLLELINSLHREYDIANTIYEIYRFIERELIQADIKRDKMPVEISIGLIEKLNTSYREVSKQDTSAPVMQNTETVYAGMTYGRNEINEGIISQSNRGFFA